MTRAMVGCVVVLAMSGCRKSTTDTADSEETGLITGCRAGPGPADRIGVVSHPYATDSSLWEVLEVDSAGALSTTGLTFSLGRATGGTVAFTPDGSVGLVVLEDGLLGAIAVSDGAVTVLETAWQGANADLYVGGVAMHPSGETALVLDPNWRNNGGQVVEVAIDCMTGALTETGRAWPSKLAQDAVVFGADEWLIAADDLGDSATGKVHRLGGAVSASADLFPDTDVIVSSMAAHGDLVVLADFSAFGGGNRLGVGRVSDGGIAPVSVVTNVEDPVDVVFSPDGGALLVSSGFGDALFAFSVDPVSSSPVQLLGELSYQGGGPALPSGIVVVPDLSMAYVAENLGVRRVEFQAGGAMVDLGRFDVGAGTDAVVGAVGIQP